MKRNKFFFWRLDFLKIAGLIALLPLGYITFWTYIGFVLGGLLIPIFVLVLLICLLPIRCPKEKQIEKTLSEYYEKHRINVLNSADKKQKKQMIFFNGFANVRAKFGRRTDSKTVFPVCRSIGFAFEDTKATVYVQDDALWEGAKCENKEVTIARGEPIYATLVSYREGAHVYLFSFRSDNKELFAFYAQDRFAIQDIANKNREFLVVDLDALQKPSKNI